MKSPYQSSLLNGSLQHRKQQTAKKYHTETDEYYKTKAREIATFVKRNYHDRELTSQSRIIKRFGVSEASLLRMFNLTFKMSFSKYRSEYRLSRSVVEVVTTNKKIRQIALEMGYEDQFYFSKAFKQRWDLSPRELRTYGSIPVTTRRP